VEQAQPTIPEEAQEEVAEAEEAEQEVAADAGQAEEMEADEEEAPNIDPETGERQTLGVQSGPLYGAITDFRNNGSSQCLQTLERDTHNPFRLCDGLPRSEWMGGAACFQGGVTCFQKVFRKHPRSRDRGSMRDPRQPRL